MTEPETRKAEAGRTRPGPSPREEAAGLYVHVPFCSGKCAYCDFFSVTDPARTAAWSDALLREAALLGPRFGPFDTLYLGGGTPSLLELHTLERLIQGLRRTVRFLPGTEVTLEVNPEDVEPDRLSAYAGMGVTRVSMGIQSLDDGALRTLGRRHSAVRARCALDRLLEAGFRSVSVDLIYGIPGQGPDPWLRTVSAVLEQGPQHLSCYELTVSPETPLGRRVASGRVQMPAEREIAALFLDTSRRLQDRGFVHYEISNFARPGHESRHNRKYWRRVPYLGLGPGAHSFLHPDRWWNPSCLDRWTARLARHRLPAEGRERLTPEQEILERLWLGFRTREGVAADLLEGVPGADRIAGELERSGLITRPGPCLVPTPQGFLVSDSLPLLFAE